MSRWWAGLSGFLVLALLLAACGAGGGTTPIVPFRTATPLASPTPRPTATPRPIATLEPTATAGALVTPRATVAAASTPTTGSTPGATATTGQRPARLTFSSENAYRHVEELSISIGIRAAGTDGEVKAADYLHEQFAALGYTVSRQKFNITTFQDNGSTLTLDVEPRQVQTLAMYYSGSGQVDAPIMVAGLGAPADFIGGVARGKVALIERGGGLTFQEKARNAKAGGAAAVIVHNNVDGPMQGSLTDPFDLPVVTITRADGQRLKQQLERRGSLRASLRVNVTTELKPSYNVLAVAPGLPPQLPIIVIGGHYDTVPAGPGANDNASGVAVMLELARVLAKEQRAELRFVAFGAEEVGLVGSKAYVEALTSAEKSRMVAMINLDMVAVGPTLAFSGSEALVARALAITESLQVPRTARLGASQRTANSDHLSFIAAGVPALLVNRPEDANYHTGQDRAQFITPSGLQVVGNVGLRLLDQLLEKTPA
jgi:aminopeptidase YwaD